jgi:thiol-disulfide isomerase/thioredoxin
LIEITENMNEVESSSITKEEWIRYINNGANFHAFYEELVQWTNALKEDKLEGHKYSHYYPLNLQRMKRGIKQLRLDPVFDELIDKVSGEINWVIITEQWCGDGAQTIPLFYKLSQIYPEKIKLTIVSRDKNLELMDEFLTNGGRSIPKLIQLDARFQITGTWGPRPEPAQELVKKLRAAEKPYADALHSWYAKDRYQTLQKEVSTLIIQHIDNEAHQRTKSA